MARSKFYYHLKRLDSVDGYEEYRKRISEIYHMNHGRYGYRRITLQMKAEGCNINHKTVRKLMLQLGIKCQIRKVKYRSYKGSVGDIGAFDQNGLSARGITLGDISALPSARGGWVWR